MVTIYSTTTCPYCKMLKEFFQSHNVEFTEKLVDQDDAARDEMMAASGGFLGVPFVVINKDNNTETVVGFDKTRISQLLQIG